jgi:hypothetical protein
MGQKHYDDFVKALTGPGAMMNPFTSKSASFDSATSFQKHSKALIFLFVTPFPCTTCSVLHAIA